MSCKDKIPQDTEKYAPFTGTQGQVANNLAHNLYNIKDIADLVECTSRRQLIQQLVLGLNRISRRKEAKTKPQFFYSQRLQRCFKFLEGVMAVDKKETWQITSNEIVVGGGDRTKPQVDLGFGVSINAQNENVKEARTYLGEEFDSTLSAFSKDEKQRINTMVNTYLVKVNPEDDPSNYKILYGIPGDETGPIAVLYRTQRGEHGDMVSNEKMMMHLIFSEPTEIVPAK